VPGTRVYVGNLDERLTERDLEDEVSERLLFWRAREREARALREALSLLAAASAGGDRLSELSRPPSPRTTNCSLAGTVP
jgi:hypothetical protein